MKRKERLARTPFRDAQKLTIDVLSPNGWSSAAGRRQRRPATETMIRSESEEGTAVGGPPERLRIRCTTGGPAAGAIGWAASPC